MSTDRCTCAPWCVEHYTADDGTGVHYGAPLSVTGTSTDDDNPMLVCVWVELRDRGPGDRELVGVVEKGRAGFGDVELSSCQLRELSRHLLAVAELVEGDGERDVPAREARLGDELRTERGWQSVTGLMHDVAREEVAIYTTSDEDPAGRFDMDAPVRVRRDGGGCR